MAEGPELSTVSREFTAGTNLTRLHLVDVTSNDFLEPLPLHPRSASAKALRVLVRPFERKGEPRDASSQTFSARSMEELSGSPLRIGFDILVKTWCSIHSQMEPKTRRTFVDL